MDVDSQAPSVTGTQARSSRKRPSPSSDVENEDAMVESLLPAAAAMKRRRVELEKENERQGISNEPSFGKSSEKAGTEKKRKPKKEVNIQEVVRERREAEEEAGRRDEESLRETLDGMDVDQMKNLALIEEMEVTHRPDRVTRTEAHHDHDNRWDERWNGRKNFKKFRRRGDPNQPRRGQSVIVPLEEVKKKDFGIGDEYWLESDKHKKKRKEKERQRSSQGVSQDQSQPFATARSQAEQGVGDVADMLQIVDAPRITRLSEKSANTQEATDQSQVASGKRSASTTLTKGASAKKQRTFAVRDSDSDSEDELKFRFKKKR